MKREIVVKNLLLVLSLLHIRINNARYIPIFPILLPYFESPPRGLLFLTMFPEKLPEFPQILFRETALHKRVHFLHCPSYQIYALKTVSAHLSEQPQATRSLI